MKQGLLLILAIFLMNNTYAQIVFEKGYFINNSNEKIDCLIKNSDWKYNPTNFKYKLSEDSEIQTGDIESVKAFGIEKILRYDKSTVKIDQSSENINKLSKDRNPIYKESEVFLKVLVEGEASLYSYESRGLEKYFYKIENAKIEPLVFKSYLGATQKIQKNTQFRQQLLNSLKCAVIEKNRIGRLEYKKKDLTLLFVDYNSCKNSTFTNYDNQLKKDLFNLTFRPRLVNSSLSINSSIPDGAFSDLRDIDFDNKTNISFGVEAEFILGFNKNKWSIIVEPTYQYFKTKKTKVVSSSFGGELTTTVNYNSVELPIGLRYYFFLNDESKIFINAFYITDFSFNSDVTYIRKDGFDLSALDINSRYNLAFGLGFKYKDRYSVELRSQTSRDVLMDYPTTFSDYKSVSVILGYSIF